MVTVVIPLGKREGNTDNQREHFTEFYYYTDDLRQTYLARKHGCQTSYAGTAPDSYSENCKNHTRNIVYRMLYFEFYMLYIAYCILDIVLRILYIVHCTLYMSCCILYMVYCTLYNGYCILYIVHGMLYKMYHILHHLIRRLLAFSSSFTYFGTGVNCAFFYVGLKLLKVVASQNFQAAGYNSITSSFSSNSESDLHFVVTFRLCSKVINLTCEKCHE